MLRSVYTKTLRDMRWGVLAWGSGLGALAVATAFGWATAYPDETSRQQLLAAIHSGLSVAQVFYGPPRAIDRLGGFIEWRVLNITPVLLGIYVILAATGMTRGAEESRSSEVVAATPRTRLRVLIEQVAALVTGIAIITALIGGLTLTSGIVTGESTPSPLRVAGACANIAAATLFFGALGLVAAQFFSRRRTAALAATGAMVVFYLANTLPLVVSGLRGLRYVSPLYLYTRSSPLANGHMDWPAFGVLLMIAAAVAGLAAFASQRRDLFDTYHLRGQRASLAAHRVTLDRSGPAPQTFLRNSLGRGVRDAMVTTASWAVGTSLLAVLMTALAPNMRQALLDQSRNSILHQFVTTEKQILSALLFSFLLPPLVTVFGVTLAGSWAGDELRQRLELELAAPVPRWRMFVERLLAAFAAVATAIVVTGLAIGATVEIGGLDVPIAAVAAALGTLFVLAACVAAIAFAVAGWRPQLAAAGAGGFVAVSYFANLVIPLFGLPTWARYLTVFGLYGNPLATGVSYWRVAVLFAITVSFAAAGAASFQRKDIAK